MKWIRCVTDYAYHFVNSRSRKVVFDVPNFPLILATGALTMLLTVRYVLFDVLSARYCNRDNYKFSNPFSVFGAEYLQSKHPLR